MILFTFTLTPNQVACLQAVAAFHDAGGNDPPPTGASLDNLPMLFPGIRDGISGSKLLFREGYIKTYNLDNPPLGKPGHNRKWRPGKGTITVWEVTEKGRCILRLIQLELRDQQQLFCDSATDSASSNKLAQMGTKRQMNGKN